MILFCLHRIYKDGLDHVTVKYKNWTTDTEWRPKDEDRQIEIFQLDDSYEQVIPKGKPRLIEPSYGQDQDFDGIRKNIG